MIELVAVEEGLAGGAGAEEAAKAEEGEPVTCHACGDAGRCWLGL